MFTKKKFNIAVILVTIAMGVILPLLAYLQYTWLGQLSKQEYERMQDNVRTTAFHCSMDFSQGMTGLIKSLVGPLHGTDEEVIRTIRRRIAAAKPIMERPDLLSDNIAISTRPLSDDVVTMQADEWRSVFVMKDWSSIALEIDGRPNACAFIRLKREELSSYVSTIIRTNFPAASIGNFDIMVVDGDQRSIWSTVDTVEKRASVSPDVTLPLFRIPHIPLSMVRTDNPMRGVDPGARMNPADAKRPLEKDAGGQGNGRIRGDQPMSGDRMREDAGVPPDPDGRRGKTERDNRFFNGPPPQPSNGLFPDEERASLLQLILQHRNGSLEAVVERNRYRSLGISFTVLLLLGSSVIFLLSAATRAQQLAQQQMEFVAGVSHELRTPLAVLKAAGENLADGVIHEHDRARQYGHLIKKEVTRLSEMVEKALTYAGIQSGRVVYDLHLLDVSVVIDEALGKIQRPGFNDDFVIDVDIEDDLPQVFGNAEALRSAVENLLLNAAKYKGEDGWVGIGAHLVRKAKERYVEITVKDKGIGIPKTDADHIFKPFYRAANAVEGQIHGSGLGLSIAKYCVDVQHGKIFVQSAVNKGSTFTIQLPLPKPRGEAS